MFGKIFICSALLGFVIGLSLWQGIIFAVFTAGVYFTGREMGYGRYSSVHNGMPNHWWSMVWNSVVKQILRG